MPPCSLPLLRPWSPENHLWGLEASGRSLVIQSKQFQCCSGDGILVDELNPRHARLCGLTRRWNLISHITKSWYAVSSADDDRPPWMDSLLAQDPNLRIESLAPLAIFFKKYLDRLLHVDKGAIVTRENFCDFKNVGANRKDWNPHLAWNVAVALAWHFEMLPLITHATSKLSPFLHWSEQLERHPNAHPLILLDEVYELWNPTRLEFVEAMIAYASERKIPVWIFERNASSDKEFMKESGSRSTTFRHIVKRRTSSMKERSSILWLSEQSRSRLSELCLIPEIKDENASIPDFI